MQVPKYDIVRTIGSGAFGYVFEAIQRKTGKRVALKRIQKVGKGMSRENQMLYMLKGCPQVIQIQELFYCENEKGKLVQNIVFEYLEDNLENVIERHCKKNTYLPQNTVKSYMWQLLSGVAHMHSLNMAHRDLKPQNILLNTSTNSLKICDFGCSKILDPKGKNTPYVMSRCYRPPQLIMAITKYSIAVDMWSVGCIMAEMTNNQTIFLSENQGDQGEQIFAILKVMGSWAEREEKQWKKRVPFDHSMFQAFKGYKGIDLDQKFKHLKDRKNFLDLLKKMLAYLPEERITAAEALKHPYFNKVKKTSTKMVDESEQQYQ